MPLFGGPPNIEKLKAKRDIQGLIKALNYEKDAKVRQAAAKALGENRDKQTIRPLTASLQDKDWLVRRAALESLNWQPSNDNQKLLAAITLGKWEEYAVALGSRAIDSLVANIRYAGAIEAIVQI
jgi:HEAT repeat protein